MPSQVSKSLPFSALVPDPPTILASIPHLEDIYILQYQTYHFIETYSCADRSGVGPSSASATSSRLKRKRDDDSEEDSETDDANFHFDDITIQSSAISATNLALNPM